MAWPPQAACCMGGEPHDDICYQTCSVEAHGDTCCQECLHECNALAPWKPRTC
jgi:hypothetical protein